VGLEDEADLLADFGAALDAATAAGEAVATGNVATTEPATTAAPVR
jgi:hypothetical protein